MTYNEKEVERVADIVMPKLNKTEKETVFSLMEEFGKYRGGKITLEKLDNKLLFTTNKVKEAVYSMEEVMYSGRNVSFDGTPYRSIRDLIEVDIEPLYNF